MTGGRRDGRATVDLKGEPGVLSGPHWHWAAATSLGRRDGRRQVPVPAAAQSRSRRPCCGRSTGQLYPSCQGIGGPQGILSARFRVCRWGKRVIRLPENLNWAPRWIERHRFGSFHGTLRQTPSQVHDPIQASWSDASSGSVYPAYYDRRRFMQVTGREREALATQLPPFGPVRGEHDS